MALFQVPENVKADNYEGVVNVIFLVNREGKFEVLYVRSAYNEIEERAKEGKTEPLGGLACSLSELIGN